MKSFQIFARYYIEEDFYVSTKPFYQRLCFKKSTLDSRSLTGHKCLAVLSDSDIHVDIDSPLDFMFADYIIRNNIKDLLS